jgi:hypothetical protein
MTDAKYPRIHALTSDPRNVLRSLCYRIADQSPETVAALDALEASLVPVDRWGHMHPQHLGGMTAEQIALTDAVRLTVTGVRVQSPAEQSSARDYFDGDERAIGAGADDR